MQCLHTGARNIEVKAAINSKAIKLFILNQNLYKHFKNSYVLTSGLEYVQTKGYSFIRWVFPSMIKMDKSDY